MTNSSPHPELSGSTVILRKFEADQIHERYIGWLNDKVVNRFSQRSRRRPTVAKDAYEYLSNLRTDEIVLGIYVEPHGHVGNVKYGPIDWDNSLADISIMIGEDAVWGGSVGSESVYLVSKFLFENLGLNRIEAGSNNPAFLRLVEKLGWQVEGVLRQRIKTNERFIDHTLVSQLSEDFRQLPRYEASVSPP
jgi:RimJ/RimL family protein N-acetyltransferase